MSDKLPEWPIPFSPADISWDRWLMLDRDAALARMEALVEYAEHTYECIENIPDGCTCGLSELLAACERRP